MIRRLADSLLSALLAPPCAVCQQVLDRPLDGAVCDICWRSIVPSSVPLRSHAHVDAAGAIGEYDGTLREIIHALKYQGRRSTAPRLSALMASHGRAILEGADAVVPVPLHPRRRRERGFNQADDLARGLGLPIVDALRRTRMTKPQVELPATERHRNVRGAFEIRGRVTIGRLLNRPHLPHLPYLPHQPDPPDPPELAGKILVLVDDVTTTGATLEACARVLKQAGALEVRALTAARVSTGPR